MGVGGKGGKWGPFLFESFIYKNSLCKKLSFFLTIEGNSLFFFSLLLSLPCFCFDLF